MTDQEKSDIKHNINNPLTILMLKLQLLKISGKEIDPDEMLKQCQRIVDYVKQI